MNTQCQNNHEYANLIISSLINLGITNFCIGSGSRSTPIAKVLEDSPSANTVVHYDERSLGFFALGVAKASNMPTCIITTSGSAVGNLYPAVMEAYMDNIPLIVITADRPFADLDRGMNQTCNQENIFGSYVKASKAFPPIPHTFSTSAITSNLAFLCHQAISSSLPVHLNLPFTEPLIENRSNDLAPTPLVKFLNTTKNLSDDSLDYLVDILSSHQKGIIIVGGSLQKSSAKDILSLSEKLQFPILADPLSGIRELGTSSTIISHYNQIIHHTKELDILKPDVILFLGGHVVSKNILLWTKSLSETKQIMVTDRERHINPTLSIDISIQMKPEVFAKETSKKIKRKEPSMYLSLWKGYSLTAENSIDDFFDDIDKMHEPSAVLELLPTLSETPFPLFFGNSLPIRYADNFLFPKKLTSKIYGNRGVSGIDGNLSTALGICWNLNTPVVAIVGDCTFLHDIGALQFISLQKIPLIIVVLNNNGGGIYNFLPYKNDTSFLNKMVSPSTNMNVGSIASSFNIPYWKATKSNDYSKMIDHLLQEKTGGIIEVPSNKEENVKLHEKLDHAINKALLKSVKKERTSYFSLPIKKRQQETSFASTDS